MTREINSPSNFMNSLMVTSVISKISFKSIASCGAKIIDASGYGLDACAFVPKTIATVLNMTAHLADNTASFIRPQTDVYYHKMVDNLKSIPQTDNATSNAWSAKTLLIDSVKHTFTGVPSVWYLEFLPKITELTPLQYNYGYKIKDSAAFKNPAYNSGKEGNYLIGPKAFYATEEDFVRAALHNEISDQWEYASSGIIDSMRQTCADLFTLSGKAGYLASSIVSISSVYLEFEGQVLHYLADRMDPFSGEHSMFDASLTADNAWGYQI